ncbi:MAG: hypothetical protein AAF902_03020 [Chloroflexota bacterium]
MAQLQEVYGDEVGFYMLDVDVPAEKRILLEYGITNPPTAFLINDGVTEARWYGLINEEAATIALNQIVSLTP